MAHTVAPGLYRRIVVQPCFEVPNGQTYYVREEKAERAAAHAIRAAAMDELYDDWAIEGYDVKYLLDPDAWDEDQHRTRE